jgi:hypothetical protein
MANTKNEEAERAAAESNRKAQATPAQGSRRAMTQAETDEAERAAESNRQATGGYDANKGPEGKGQHRAKVVNIPEDEIRDGIRGIIDGFKGRANKDSVVNILRSEAELLFRDTWAPNRENLDYDPDDLDDPRANPMGLRPAPATATRADEHTAREPDSMGNIIDRKSAELGLNDDSLTADDENIPPPDRDAVAAKRGAERSVEEYGTAGGSGIARAEHKDDPKPRKK